MNTRGYYKSLKTILLNIVFIVHSAFAAMSNSDCKAPCTDFDWRTLCRVTKAAPVVTLMPPVQEFLLYDISNPGIKCPDSIPAARPPKQTFNVGTEKKEYARYEIEIGTKWETFGLTTKVSGEKTFTQTTAGSIEVTGYCQHVSADIAKSDKITTVEVTEFCALTPTRFRHDETLHEYSLFYRSPAVPQSPDDPNCMTKCEGLF